MKRNILGLLFLVLIQACTSKNPVEQSSEAPISKTIEEVPKGLTLITDNDCQTCHHIDNKLIGPSYNAIALKYEETDVNAALLISKIIKGGTGVWGDMPMNAHPTLSEQDAKEMVGYILSLDNDAK